MTWFEVFKVGVWNGMRYRKRDLDEMVENFEKKVCDVPLIIGHNDWNGEKPAHGWLSDLKRVGKKLMAKTEKVSDELKKAVNERIYPKRSVEIWREYNGCKNVLGAVAFLGGSNPAVNKMADFQFANKNRASGAGAEVITFKMGGGIPLKHKAKFQKKLNEIFEIQVSEAQKQKIKEAVEQFKKKYELTDEQSTEIVGAIEAALEEVEAPAELIDEIVSVAEEIIQEEIADEEDPDGGEGDGAFSANSAQAKLAKENQELRERFNRLEAERNVEKCSVFANNMLTEKRITPAILNGGLVGFMASLSTEAKYKFGKTKESQLDYFQGLLKALPASGEVLFNEVDKSGERSGESVGSGIEAFAKKHGLDPKLLADNIRNNQ